MLMGFLGICLVFTHCAQQKIHLLYNVPFVISLVLLVLTQQRNCCHFGLRLSVNCCRHFGISSVNISLYVILGHLLWLVLFTRLKCFGCLRCHYPTNISSRVFFPHSFVALLIHDSSDGFFAAEAVSSLRDKDVDKHRQLWLAGTQSGRCHHRFVQNVSFLLSHVVD